MTVGALLSIRCHGRQCLCKTKSFFEWASTHLTQFATIVWCDWIRKQKEIRRFNDESKIILETQLNDLTVASHSSTSILIWILSKIVGVVHARRHYAYGISLNLELNALIAMSVHFTHWTRPILALCIRLRVFLAVCGLTAIYFHQPQEVKSEEPIRMKNKCGKVLCNCLREVEEYKRSNSHWKTLTARTVQSVFGVCRQN